MSETGSAENFNDGKSYFSISFTLVQLNEPILYDVYVNSSVIEKRERYVRVFPKGGVLSEDDLAAFKNKYRRIYVAESQRHLYLKSLCRLKGRHEREKATVLKDSAIEYLGQLFDHSKHEFSTEVFNAALSGCRDVVEGLVDVLQGYNVDNLQNLIASLSFHDFYTYDHSINVSMYCILLYRLYKPGASRAEIINAGFAGLLHDLGKIKIPTQIINKPGKLTPEEFKEIMMHPVYGHGILDTADVRMPEGIDIKLLARVVYEHHECIDGTGYPNKLKADDISLHAKVTAIADFFDAITTKRSYHDALTTEEALALMNKSVDKKIDGIIFELLTHHAEHFELKRETDLTLLPEFDPCQPSHQPRWQRVSESSVKPDLRPEKGFGRIILVEEKKKKQKV